MPYHKISRNEMIRMLHVVRVEYDSLIAHRDGTFTARRRFTNSPILAQGALVDKLCRTTHAVMLAERVVRRSDTGYVEFRFAFKL